ncbi:MAG: hypothetical protein RL325_1323 [Planctomycetota bacterium]
MLAVVALGVAFLVGCASKPAGTPLFSAMPYDSWRILGSRPQFTLADAGGVAVLTGRGPIPSNGFLASPREVADFRLEVDVRLGSAENPRGERMNSGVQVRSREQDGTCAGLQIEVDPTPRAWSGGVYDERGRGWLAPLDGKDAAGEAARAAFRLGEWNRYEIECMGPRIRTRVNGVPCAEWYDGCVRGLLAFQVHGGPPCEVAFRGAAIEELGEHAWIAASGPALPLDDHSRGVRFLWKGGGEIVFRSGQGEEIARAAVDSGDSPRLVEAVWLEGRGAVLVGGKRVETLAFRAEPARAEVAGDATGFESLAAR